MPRAVIGVIGHVDHGKTALVRALTGMETDRLAEEKARGISIALGFAHLGSSEAPVDLIDMPGHERFVRTMIAGATGIDAVLLVVAANEGIKPQTREHVDIAGLLGVGVATVAVTKCDLAPAVDARAVAQEARELLAAAGVASGAPVMTSATTGEGIAQLRGALTRLAAQAPPRRDGGLCWLPIDRAFSMTGHGPVVTGTLRGAPIHAGDTLALLPGDKTVRLRALQVHGAPVAAARPGERTAVNLRDVAIGELRRGMALAAPGAFAPSEWLTLALRAVGTAPALANGMRLRALFGTEEVDARLRLLDRDTLEPGEAALAQLRLDWPAALPAREVVVLRIASPAATVAGGRVLEPVTRRRRRRDAQGLAWLASLRDLAPERFIAAEVERADTTVARLSQLTALAPERVEERLLALPVVVTRKGAVLRLAELERLAEQLPAVIGREALGLSRSQLAALLPGTRAAALDEALARLAAAGTIARRGGQFVVPSPDADRVRARTEAEVAAEIAELLRLNGLSPPNPAAIVTDAARARAVERLLRQGLITRAVDRAKHREMLFHKHAIEEACRRLAPLLEDGPGLLVTEIGAALGISRKYTMPLLDHLDTIRFTRRVGDRRQRGPGRLI